MGAWEHNMRAREHIMGARDETIPKAMGQAWELQDQGLWGMELGLGFMFRGQRI